MASQGDIIQVSLEMLWSNITTMRNVFYYRLDDPPTASYLTGLDTEFQTRVLVPYAATQGTALSFTSIEYLNIFTGDTLTNVAPSPAAGTRTLSGDPSPSFMALMILLERKNSRVRNGRKYIFAPSEADITGNGFAAGFQTLANTLKSGMVFLSIPELLTCLYPALSGVSPIPRRAGR